MNSNRRQDADPVRLREVADAVADKVRLKKGGEVVKYTRAVLEALDELGYRVSPAIMDGA
jgi:hypothetical protein